MKLATFDDGSRTQTGIVVGDRLIPTGWSGNMTELIARWDELRTDLQERAASRVGVALSTVRLLAPVPRPGKIFAIGLNYADHIAESRMETPQEQVWFTKATTSVNGPFDPVQIPKTSPFVDYEIELVVVIGKGGKYIAREDAADHVMGYCVGNDVTERMWQHRTPQWSLGKSFDTHAPFGPWITTRDEVGDVHALDLTCWVNGQIRQTSNTRHLVFDIFAQIEHLSQAMTLEPGDLIFTGTPAGVGAAMTPRQFLKPGDVVRCDIAGLGRIENRCEAAV
jgi:2-keto-4-pentenoate hydratase/2-oxohepta-3-ene-1,7-dioic acid hydratase in catechol pathway